MEHWDYLEKLLGNLYRKEIDNEENIWRSLSFFSATLAVEVAVVGRPPTCRSGPREERA